MLAYYVVNSNCQFCFIYLFDKVSFSLGFTPCKAEQPLQGTELQEKEAQKIKAYKKSV